MANPTASAATVKTTSQARSGSRAGRLGAIVRRFQRSHMGHTVGAMEAFGTILIVVCVVAVVVAAFSFYGSGTIYKGLGRSGAFSMDEPDRRRPAPGPMSAAASAEAQEEIRQMLQAKSDRREGRGQAPLDIEAEMESLNRPATPQVDDALREEVRQLVVARNERRARQGKPPLEVEEEIDRQLRDIGA